MAIKQAITTPTSLEASVQVDSILAELESGKPLNRKSIILALKGAKHHMDLPESHLSDSDRAEQLIEKIQGSGDPLQYSRVSFTQDFFANHYLPYSVRHAVAKYLWSAFGAVGNPIWKNYVDGTFRYIEPTEADYD